MNQSVVRIFRRLSLGRIRRRTPGLAQFRDSQESNDSRHVREISIVEGWEARVLKNNIVSQVRESTSTYHLISTVDAGLVPGRFLGS